MSDQHDTTSANADLWSRYFQNEWARWAPADSPVAEIAEGTAARVAGFLTLVAAGPIAWLYAANEPRVAKISGQPAQIDHQREDYPREEASGDQASHDEDVELEMVLAGSAA